MADRGDAINMPPYRLCPLRAIVVSHTSRAGGPARAQPPRRTRSARRNLNGNIVFIVVIEILTFYFHFFFYKYLLLEHLHR